MVYITKKQNISINNLMDVLNNAWNESEIANVKRNLEINEIKSILIMKMNILKIKIL